VQEGDGVEDEERKRKGTRMEPTGITNHSNGQRRRRRRRRRRG